MSDDVPKPAKDPATGRFLAGNSGNGGRPKRARNKLSEAFIAGVAEDFEAHGAAAIARVREEDPSTYVRVIASLLPKELKVDADPLEDLSDAQLSERIQQLAAALGLRIVSLGEDGDDEASGLH